jgi:hypothetical protein
VVKYVGIDGRIEGTPIALAPSSEIGGNGRIAADRDEHARSCWDWRTAFPASVAYPRPHAPGVSIQPISTSSGETSSQLLPKYFVSVKLSPAPFSFAHDPALAEAVFAGEERRMPAAAAVPFRSSPVSQRAHLENGNQEDAW